MRNTPLAPEQLTKFLGLIEAMGRRNSLRDPFALMVERTELGHAQLHALMWLFKDGPLGMGELAQRIGTTQKTVTGIVDRLERQGFARRDRSTKDRRVVHVGLTPKGQKLAAQLDQGISRNVKRFLELLEDRDRRDLFRILENLLAKLDQQFSAVKPTATSD